MPYKDPEKQREYQKKYKKEYREKNREKIKEYQKEYQKEYREKNKEKQKKYRESEKGRNSVRISKWKSRGILSDNYDELYDRFINTEYCELCSVKLTVDRYNTKTTRCLDHDHKTGLVRNILCIGCNVKRG